jgi:hypothetical protein
MTAVMVKRLQAARKQMLCFSRARRPLLRDHDFLDGIGEDFR